MPQLQNNDQRNFRISGLVGTLLFHGLLLISMVMFLYRTPIPPFPETGGGQGSGLEVNLGYSSQGMGDFQPTELSIPQFKESAKPNATIKVADNTIKSNTAGSTVTLRHSKFRSTSIPAQIIHRWCGRSTNRCPVDSVGCPRRRSNRVLVEVNA